MREPHGSRPGIAWWTGGASTADAHYDRLCTFTDGHAEGRIRVGYPVPIWLDLPCPWMNGDWTSNNQTTADPAE